MRPKVQGLGPKTWVLTAVERMKEQPVEELGADPCTDEVHSSVVQPSHGSCEAEMLSKEILNQILSNRTTDVP